MFEWSSPVGWAIFLVGVGLTAFLFCLAAAAVLRATKVKR